MVVAADMGELVGGDGFTLDGRQAAETTQRNENNGTQPADHGRDLDERGLKEPDGTRDFNAAGESTEDVEEVAGWGVSRGGHHAAGDDQAHALTKGEDNSPRPPRRAHAWPGRGVRGGATVHD